MLDERCMKKDITLSKCSGKFKANTYEGRDSSLAEILLKKEGFEYTGLSFQKYLFKYKNLTTKEVLIFKIKKNKVILYTPSAKGKVIDKVENKALQKAIDLRCAELGMAN